MAARENKTCDLKAAAQEYWDQGLNIVLMTILENGKKDALHNWKQWETRRQTREEFDALPWLNAERFAVVCGVKGSNGLFFCSIDTDNPDFEQNLLRVTQTERTPKGGHHFVYWSRVNARGKKLHDLKIELLGQGNLCLMHPSKDYVKLNDNLPTEIDDISEVFQDLAEKLGGHVKRKIQRRIRYCCREALVRDNHIAHLMRLTIASEYKHAGYSNEDIVQLFKSQTDFDHEKSLVQVESADPTKRARKETIKEYGYCYPECKEDCEDWAQTEEFNPVVFAEVLLDEYTFKTTKDTETLYVYDAQDRIYKTTGEVLVKAKMAEKLHKDTRQKYYADVMFYIKGMTYFDRPEPPKDKLALENGILNVITRDLTTDSKDDFITAKLPVTYDPLADCPTIKKFLDDVVGPEQSALIQEFAGYCLYQDYFIHKAFMFIGTGANGKSTLLSLIRSFLGENNVSNVTLQALCSGRFAPAQLYGKLANLCADIPDKPLEQTGMFKMVTGKDAVTFEEKFKRGFSTVNTAKLGFSTNKAPETHDDTDAFFRRWLTISCNNVFIGQKCDKHIIDKLTTPQELSGFLNYALDGLKRLLETSEFSQIEDLERQRTQYIRQSNSSKAYIEEQLEASLSDKDVIIEHDLYEKYIAFCVENKLASMKKRQFTENMQQYMPKAKQTTARIEGKAGVHVWQFLKFVAAVASDILNLMKYDIKDENHKEKSKSIELERLSIAAATAATPEPEEKTCGRCVCWHKPSCSYPDADPSCVAITNKYAADCRNYVPGEEGEPEP